MDERFRLVTRALGAFRVADFDDTDDAWDAFASAVRGGHSAFLFQGGELKAYMLGGPNEPARGFQ